MVRSALAASLTCPATVSSQAPYAASSPGGPTPLLAVVSRNRAAACGWPWPTATASALSSASCGLAAIAPSPSE